MISQSTLFLFILLIIGLIENQSLTVAIGVLFLLKFTF